MGLVFETTNTKAVVLKVGEPGHIRITVKQVPVPGLVTIELRRRPKVTAVINIVVETISATVTSGKR